MITARPDLEAIRRRHVLAEPSDDRAEDIAYALAALRSAAQRLGA